MPYAYLQVFIRHMFPEQTGKVQPGLEEVGLVARQRLLADHVGQLADLK